MTKHCLTLPPSGKPIFNYQSQSPRAPVDRVFLPKQQFLPKGTDFNDIDKEEIDKAAALLNNRPRECLDYRTLREVLWSR